MEKSPRKLKGTSLNFRTWNLMVQRTQKLCKFSINQLVLITKKKITIFQIKGLIHQIQTSSDTRNSAIMFKTRSIFRELILH